MKVLAVAVNKGGVGKTTLSKSLATAAALEGRVVLLLDMDTQQNSTKWGRRREKLGKTLPLVRFTTEGDLEDEIERARKAGCDLVVIDTPPGRGSEAPAAVEAADLILIPCAAEDVDSFDGVPKTARLARTVGKPAVGLLNVATPGSVQQEKTARAVMEMVGIPFLPVVMHRFKEHRDANPKGLTALEMEPDGQAARETTALWAWVCAQLQMGTIAHVHKKVKA